MPTVTASSITPPYPLSNSTTAGPISGQSTGFPSSPSGGGTGLTSPSGPSSTAHGSAPYPLTNSTASIGPTGTSAPSGITTGGPLSSTTSNAGSSNGTTPRPVETTSTRYNPTSPPYPLANSTQSAGPTGPTGIPSSTLSESELPISGTGPISSSPTTSSLSAPFPFSNTTTPAMPTGGSSSAPPILTGTSYSSSLSPSESKSVPFPFTNSSSALPTGGSSSVATTGPGALSTGISPTRSATPTPPPVLSSASAGGSLTAQSTTQSPVTVSPPYPLPNGTVPYNTTCTGGETAPPRVTASHSHRVTTVHVPPSGTGPAHTASSRFPTRSCNQTTFRTSSRPRLSSTSLYFNATSGVAANTGTNPTSYSSTPLSSLVESSSAAPTASGKATSNPFDSGAAPLDHHHNKSEIKSAARGPQ
ncbi:hypothetical protein QBC37DRAFT_375648 [Rhypophila decipiens]|uniref:Uncharacterized protein n=1 Tax=Rhypophila decipiens TaxID=261697 RepID=A0AAN6Y4Q6_9PEZI|nr:hypothetical protein QBC37DRAFT_375648 [Rhypophila decipiens]